MKRRAVLTAVGASLVPLSGCESQGSADTATVTPAPVPNATTTETPHPTQPGSRPCPSYPDGHGDGRTICDGNEWGAPVYLAATTETVADSGDRLRFQLVNNSGTDITYGPNLWTLYAQTPDGWEIRRSLEGNAGARLLPAGEAHPLTVHVRSRPPETDRLTYEYETPPLDPGTYLFGIGGTAPDGSDALFLASFRVEQATNGSFSISRTGEIPVEPDSAGFADAYPDAKPFVEVVVGERAHNTTNPHGVRVHNDSETARDVSLTVTTGTDGETLVFEGEATIPAGAYLALAFWRPAAYTVSLDVQRETGQLQAAVDVPRTAWDGGNTRGNDAQHNVYIRKGEIDVDYTNARRKPTTLVVG